MATAAVFLAAQSSVPTDRRAWRTLNLSAGAQYDRRVNVLGGASAAAVTDLQTNRQYLKALTDSGQLAAFQGLTAG